jgi:hypothetical protein
MKARDPDVTIINLESEEIEEVESFEDDAATLQMDDVGTGSEQQHVDVLKVSGLCQLPEFPVPYFVFIYL